MDWADSPQQAEFRAKVRAFFEANLPQRYREDAGPLRPHMIRASNRRSPRTRCTPSCAPIRRRPSTAASPS